MARKTLDESRKAWLAFYEKHNKDKKKMTKVTFTLSGGNNFTIEADSNTIAAYLATQTKKSNATATPEFAGLASVKLPETHTLADVKALEVDVWIALE